MSLSHSEYLRHILDETEYLMKQLQGLDEEAFSQDETLQRAFVRSLEIIGEAFLRVSDKPAQLLNGGQWRE
jgi:uncharacterized protein with HEPN domain